MIVVEPDTRFSQTHHVRSVCGLTKLPHPAQLWPSGANCGRIYLMVILQVIRSRNFAGSEQFMLTLCKALSRHGHRCIAVIVPGGRLEKIAREQGLEIAPFSASSHFSRERLAAWARLEGVQVVHTHLTGGARLGLFVAERLGIPCVSHLHIYRPDAAYAKVAAYSRGSLVGVSRHVAAFYESNLHLPEGSVPVVMNASFVCENPDATCDRVRLATEVAKELKLPVDARMLLVAGRLSKGKGQDVMIDAMPEIVARHPEAHLLLAGTSKRGSFVMWKLMRQVIRLKMGRNVHFLGFRKDGVRLMRAADVCLLPSRSDVMPLVAIEAMMLDACLVASNVCGVPELVHDGDTGVLVPPEDKSRLAQAVCGLLDDKGAADAMGVRAALFAQSVCDPGTLAARIEGIYEACRNDAAVAV
jgi:glycosyltransferase involved in cell wall biosynthesis